MAKNKSSIWLQYPAIFSADKAYSMTIVDGTRVHLSIITAIPDGNGGKSWDFKNNSTRVLLDFEDVSRLLSMCKTIAYIFMNKDKLDEKFKNVRSLQMPLVAKSSGNQYGEITVGISDKSDDFAISYSYKTMQDNTTVNDWFVFRTATGAETAVNFRARGSSGEWETVHTSQQKYIQFARFISQLEGILKYGQQNYAIVSSIKYSKGSSNNNNNNSWGGNNGAENDPFDNGGTFDSGGENGIPF